MGGNSPPFVSVLLRFLLLFLLLEAGRSSSGPVKSWVRRPELHLEAVVTASKSKYDLAESARVLIAGGGAATPKDYDALLQQCFVHSKMHQSLAWSSAAPVLVHAKTCKVPLSVASRTKACKMAVRTRAARDLAELVPLLFQSPLPSSETLDNVMRVLENAHPQEALVAFNAFVMAPQLTAEQTPTVPCYLRAITAVAALVRKHSKAQAGLADKLLLPILQHALDHDCLSISMIVNALVLCRELGEMGVAWQTSMALYTMAKLAVKAGKLFAWEKIGQGEGAPGGKHVFQKSASLDKLPSVVYGQALITFARGGAEAQTYLLVCEMLESGVTPSSLTLDNVFLELSRGGAFAVMLSIREQLERFRVPISDMALNALLNACDKAGAYQKSVDIFTDKTLTAAQLDTIGLGVLIKACDKTLRPDVAVLALLSVGERMPLDAAIYERVFAVLVKSGAGDLATHLVYELEQQQQHDAPSGQMSSLKQRLLQTLDSGQDVSMPSSGQIDVVVEEDDAVLEIIEGIMETTFSAVAIEKFARMRSFKEIQDMVEEEGGGVDKYSITEGSDDRMDDLLRLQSCPPLVSQRLYSALIASLSKAGRATDAFRVLKSYIQRGGNASSEMFVSAIYAWRHSRNPDGADMVMEYFRDHVVGGKSVPSEKMGQTTGIPLEAYNALLIVYAVSRVLPFRQEAVLAEMRLAGMEWDSHTFTALLMGNHGNEREDVLGLWKQMVQHGVEPSVAAVFEVIKASLVTKRGRVALDLLTMLWDKEPGKPKLPGGSSGAPVPDLPMCTLTLLALSRGGHCDDCMQLLTIMRDKGINPSPSCYGIVLSALEKAAEWKHAINVILQMHQRGLRVDAKNVNAALGACSRASQWEMILKLSDQLPTLTRHNFVPNHFSFSHVLLAGMKLNDASKCLEVLKTWAQAATSSHDVSLPSFTSISHCISALETAGRHEDSLDVFENYLSSTTSTGDLLPDGSMIIDLHGYSIPVAKAATRFIIKCAQQTAKTKIVLITGIGKGVLRPAILEFLDNEIPEASAFPDPDNPGRVRINL